MSEAVDDVTHVREWDHNAEPPDPHAAGGAAIDLSAPGQFVISAENATRYRVVVVSEKADVSVDKLQQDPDFKGDGFVASFEGTDSGGSATIDVGQKSSELAKAGDGAKLRAFAIGFNADGKPKAADALALTLKGKPPATAPAGTLESRMKAAWHSARLAIQHGAETSGAGKSWETAGANRGPYVDEIEKYLDGSGLEWCGIFHGYNYGRAGFDYKRPFAAGESYTSGKNRKVLFWSTERILHYWKATGCKTLTFPYKGGRGKWTREQCEGWLRDTFQAWGPLPGDIMIVDSFKEKSHVVMLAGYDPATYEAITYEGNYKSRGGAWRWDLGDPHSPAAGAGPRGFFRINVIGRFKESDFLADPGEVKPDESSPDPDVEDMRKAKKTDAGR